MVSLTPNRLKVIPVKGMLQFTSPIADIGWNEKLFLPPSRSHLPLTLTPVACSSFIRYQPLAHILAGAAGMHIFWTGCSIRIRHAVLFRRTLSMGPPLSWVANHCTRNITHPIPLSLSLSIHIFTYISIYLSIYLSIYKCMSLKHSPIADSPCSH